MRRARLSVRSAIAIAVFVLALGVPTVVGNASVSAPAPPWPHAALSPHAGVHGLVVPPEAVRASGSLPTLQWALAFILYGPGDDSTHFMGEGTAMAIDDHLRNITSFGGEGEGGLIGYTMDYNYSNGDFSVNVLNPTPSARTNASFADAPGRDFAVLFGGITNLSTHAAANDTWVYYFANQTWRNVTRSVAPPARESAAFAVNGSGDSALLEGGWAPDATVDGSTATVFWNDTWTLNLTSFVWSPVPTVHGPPPLFGSGMVWQNATHAYDLFGGCALTCSAAMWQFGGQPAHWHELGLASGPGARASGAFVWDAANGLAFLYGGFEWSANGTTPLGDGWFWDPASGAWTPENLPASPGPVFDAPNAWADFPGCVGFLTVGGNTALAGPPGTASVLEPIRSASNNCFPDLISGNSSPPPPPCSGNHSTLSLEVVNGLTGAGIPDATVEVDGACLKEKETADGHGFLNLTLPAPDDVNFTGIAGGFRTGEVTHEFLPNATYSLLLPLDPDPSLKVRAWNLTANGSRAPLPGVTIQEANFVDLGVTDVFGNLTDPALDAPAGPLTIYGLLADHSTGSDPIVVPVSGPVYANVTLDAAGALTVDVVSRTTGAPIANATGTLSDLDPGAPRPVTFTANLSGAVRWPGLEAANYSVSAVAPGFYANSTVFLHPWLQPQTVPLTLRPLPPATLDALVRSAVTSAPLVGATVEVVGVSTTNSTALGWANFSGLDPTAPFEVIASASGYATNYSYVQLSYGEVFAPYPILMHPLVGCSGPPFVPPPAGCPKGTGNGSGPPAFAFLTGGSGATLLVLATPAALLAAGIAYALYLGRRTEPVPPARPVTTRGTP